MTLDRETIRDDLEAQLELPNFPRPKAAKASVDFSKPCPRCQQECDYCKGWKDFNPKDR